MSWIGTRAVLAIMCVLYVITVARFLVLRRGSTKRTRGTKGCPSTSERKGDDLVESYPSKQDKNKDKDKDKDKSALSKRGVAFVNGGDGGRSDHVRLRHCGNEVTCREYRNYRGGFVIKEDKPYLFVHIPKNAGTWVRQMFPGMNGGHDHMTLRTMMRRFPHVTNGCYTFAIVRNPWDRVVSMYNNHVNTERMEMKGWGHHGKRIMDKHNVRTFEDFVRMLHKYRTNIRSLGEIVWERQTEFITDSNGELMVDEIIYMEALNSRIEQLKRRFDVTLPTPPERVNSSETTDYRAYYVTKELRDMVAEIYASDVELTKYVF